MIAILFTIISTQLTKIILIFVYREGQFIPILIYYAFVNTLIAFNKTSIAIRQSSQPQPSRYSIVRILVDIFFCENLIM